MASSQFSFSSQFQKTTGNPYYSIDAQKEEIRLAILAPGDYDDDIVIQLQIESLSGHTKPEYEALSYVWGTIESPCISHVNGKPLTIGTNLECALRHLRFPDRKRVLWIDALCINQADVLERSSQVQLMGSIYYNASAVAIWLGPSDSDDEELICKAQHVGGWDTQSLMRMARIGKRPWFHRVWVVQEFLLAQEDPIMYLGCASINWRQLHWFIKMAIGELWPKRCVDAEMVPHYLEFIKATFPIVGLGFMRAERFDNTFAANLMQVTAFEATDPRDKVYGLLGLQSFSKYPVRVTPDYTKTLCEVLVDTCKTLIEDDPIDLYGRLSMQPPPGNHFAQCYDIVGLATLAAPLKLISYCIDSVASNNQPKECVSDESIGARTRVGHVTAELQETKFRSLSRFSGHGTLQTVGKFMGTIVDSYGDLGSDIEAFDPQFELRPLSHDVVLRIYDTLLKPRKISIEVLSQAFYTCLDKGTYEYTEIEATFKQLLDKRGSNIALTNRQLSMLGELDWNTRKIIIFVTSEGHVGMVYHPDIINGIHPGDVVVGLFGINLPFVLRRASDGNNYEIINIAYIGEHMYSQPALVGLPEETTEKDIWDNLRTYGLEKYTIV